MKLAFAAKNSQQRGGSVSDARTGKRFPLELPIKIHKEAESGEHSGVTGNLSAAGVYIRADASLEIGYHVEVEIKLPPEGKVAYVSIVVPGQRPVRRSVEDVWV